MPEKKPFLFLEVPERYIEEPIKPTVRVSVVVPLFKEYENGNIFRLIDTFSRQSVPSDRFEVLCVVNNPREHAEQNTQAFQENQRVLELGSQVKAQAPVSPKFTPYQQSVVKRAQDYGLSIHMIDVTPGGVERNMGRARQVGVIEATKRLQEAEKKKKGIIAHMDADTVVERRYIEKLVSFFERTGVDSTALHYDYVMPHGDSRLYKTSQVYDRRNWYYRLAGLLAGIPTVSSPQIAATVEAHDKIGGVPLRAVGEDVILFDSLRSRTKFSSAPHITVFAADRARAESFDGSGRYHSLDKLKDAVCPNPAIDLSRKAIALRKYEEPSTIPGIDFVQEIFNRFGLVYDDVSLQNLFRSGYSCRDDFFSSLDNFIRSGQNSSEYKTILEPVEYADSLIAIFSNWSTPEEKKMLDDMLRREERTQKVRHNMRVKIVKAILESSIQKGSLEAALEGNVANAEFVSQNPWMKDIFKELFMSGVNNEVMFQSLANEFPGFLGAWVEDLQGCTAKFKGLINFVMKCKHDRDQYPGVYRAIDYFSTPLVL